VLRYPKVRADREENEWKEVTTQGRVATNQRKKEKATQEEQKAKV